MRGESKPAGGKLKAIEPVLVEFFLFFKSGNAGHTSRLNGTAFG